MQEKDSEREERQNNMLERSQQNKWKRKQNMQKQMVNGRRHCFIKLLTDF